MPSSNGSGEAYQYWNRAHSRATAKMKWAVAPTGLRPPVSLSATSCCKASGAFSMSVLMVRSGLPGQGKKKNGEAPSPFVNGGPHKRRPGTSHHLTQPFSL
jgi:hypothetical protein